MIGRSVCAAISLMISSVKLPDAADAPIGLPGPESGQQHDRTRRPALSDGPLHCVVQIQQTERDRPFDTGLQVAINPGAFPNCERAAQAAQERRRIPFDRVE